ATVRVEAGTGQTLAVPGTIRFEGLQAGSHTVTLAGAATNCPFAPETPRTVSVTTGAVRGDTARTAFQVACVATTAVIEVAAATSGIDIDPDGYTVQVDGSAARALAVGGTTRFEGLAAGSHTVTLTGAAANCPVAPDNPRAVSVTTGAVTRDTARTTFQVTCGAATGSIQVTAATAGIDLDPNGYAVQVDGTSLRQLLGAGTATFDGLAGGDHSVVLSVGPARPSPSAADTPRAVSVTTGAVTRDTASTTFHVTCGAATGSIQVTAATSGIDLDPDGYTVLLDNGQQRPLGVNGTAVIEGVNGGDHSVILFGAVGNCALAGANPRTVHVTTGGVTRDTGRTTFQLTCVRVEKTPF